MASRDTAGKDTPGPRLPDDVIRRVMFFARAPRVAGNDRHVPQETLAACMRVSKVSNAPFTLAPSVRPVAAHTRARCTRLQWEFLAL